MSYKNSRPAETRFWEKVNKDGPIILDTPCWLWTGARSGGRYGHIWVKGAMMSAHRFSYELRNPPLTGKLQALHRCDNPPCVNPDHLFAGDNFSNRVDCLHKGRLSWAVMTADGVRELRRRSAAGERNIDLAKAFGIHPGTVSGIIRRMSWKHLV